MRNKARCAKAAAVVALLAAGISLAQVVGPDQMMKGIEFTRASSMKPYNSGEAYQSLKLAQTAGAKWITIVPVYWMSDTGAPSVFWMDNQSPPDDEVRQAVRWAKQLDLEVFMKPEVHCLSGVESFLDTLGNPPKPVIFTEIGYRSVDGCSNDPGKDTASGTYDSTEQRNCYIAALHSLLGKPWFAGWFWHEWTTDTSQGGPGDLSYSPKGKPAQEVLRRWSAAIGTQRSISLNPGFDNCHAYEEPRTAVSLTNMCATGAQWVTILPQGWMNDIDSAYGSIAVNDTRTSWPASPCSTALAQVIDWARERGLRVMLKPHVDCINGAYRNDHDPQGTTRDAWFDDYRDYIVRYAKMAELMKCEMFCVGCEVGKTANDQADLELWREEVIPAVREVYSGPITFAQLCIDNGIQPGLWDDLDFVGVDAYFDLFPAGQYNGSDTTSAQRPNLNDLQTDRDLGWEYVRLPQFETLYRHAEKPILFTEAGYQTIDSAALLGAKGRSYSWIPQDGTTHNGQVSSYFGVCFPWDTLTGYVVGTHGAALRTTNSGTNWAWVNTGTQETLRAVHFPCIDTGFAVGDSGTIVKFRPGGAELCSLPGFRRNLRSVFFPNRAAGFAVGDAGAILRTTNWGASWALDSTGTACLRSVHFPSDSVGFVVGDAGIILKTTDCGATWTRPDTPTTVTPRSVYFFSLDSGYAVGDSSSFLRTYDCGNSWSCEYMPTRHHELRAVAVPARRRGGDLSAFVASDQWNTVRVNSDWDIEGGFQQWNTHQGLRSICFPDSRVGFAVGDSGTIVRTYNGGRLRIDFNEQKNCYEAEFLALWRDSVHLTPYPWFYGFHLWDWWTDTMPKRSNHEPWLPSGCLQDKPAEAVVTRWYGARPQDPGPAGYHVRHYPTGSLDVVVPAGGKTNAPLVLCQLESHNWEEGGSADSARLLQEYYGLGDTLIAAESTAWFRFAADTTWRFLHGQGRYRLYAQYLVVPGKVSPPYPDFVDTVIVFDTVSATGSLVINGGARFATSSTCTLRLAAQDSGSGVAAMRFLNDPQANLVQDGAFTATAGSWQFTNGVVDTALCMARLTVGPSQAGVRQFIPAESISAHSGDSCALEASILAHVHDGNASGDLSFWFYSIGISGTQYLIALDSASVTG